MMLKKSFALLSLALANTAVVDGGSIPMGCPDQRPDPGDGCDFDGSCEYGKISCCGKSYPEYIAHCMGYEIGLIQNDACMYAECPTSGGDPHFKTWTGQRYDFHGGCDLVLLTNPNYANGLGLDVHIRTQIKTWWSYIDTAAVRLGEHTLEIKGGEGQIPYWLNGKEVANMETGDAALGDYAIHFRRVNDHQTKTRVDLGHDNALSIETFKHFVRVNIKVEDREKFDGSFGLLGSHPGGDKVARDHVTVVEDSDQFGQEWQVLPTEPQLFHTPNEVQHPMKCVMPKDTKKNQQRRLGEAMITLEQAELACARVVEDEERDACIFDVLATNDKDMAGSY